MITLLLPLWLGFAPPEAAADLEAVGSDASGTDAEAGQDPAPAEVAPAPAPEPTPTAAPAAAPAPVEPMVEGPPYYTQEDINRLRERYGVAPDPQLEPRKPKWRCLIPDPSCGFGVEVVATTAYAYRARQGNISINGASFNWDSARVAYDLWLNFPAHVQTLGNYKFTRLSLGPKVAIVASDNQDLWGNMGVALRYWFGTGKWSPALEFTSALSFKLVGEDDDVTGTMRSPVGITADIGINIGGWGAIIVGGQYDSPLAREEIPEKFRISAAGQMFVGFRGNILWGAPAAAAVGTHIAIQRALPNQP